MFHILTTVNPVLPTSGFVCVRQREREMVKVAGDDVGKVDIGQRFIKISFFKIFKISFIYF